MSCRSEVTRAVADPVSDLPNYGYKGELRGGRLVGQKMVEAHYADRALMAQPFANGITAEGEFSLFYFDGEHSHTILKTPKAADFGREWAHLGSNQGPLACEASALPLSYAPGTFTG